MKGEPLRPSAIDTTVPSVARMYDYYLGGKDNYAADRDACEELEAGAQHPGAGGQQPAVPAAGGPLLAQRIRRSGSSSTTDPACPPRTTSTRSPSTSTRTPTWLRRQRPHRAGTRPALLEENDQHRCHPGGHAGHRRHLRPAPRRAADRLRPACRRAVRLRAALHPGRATTRPAWSGGSPTGWCPAASWWCASWSARTPRPATSSPISWPGPPTATGAGYGRSMNSPIPSRAWRSWSRAWWRSPPGSRTADIGPDQLTQEWIEYGRRRPQAVAPTPRDTGRRAGHPGGYPAPLRRRRADQLTCLNSSLQDRHGFAR